MNIWPLYILPIVLVMIPTVTEAISINSNPVVAIYGSNPIYSLNNHNIQDNIDELKASGFDTIIFWSIHVNTTGDLIYNDHLIVKDGVYVGDERWPHYIAQLKQGTTSVKRIVFSVGAWGNPDFANICDLLTAQGKGPDNILYRNFKALRDTIKVIDGIDLDNEDLFDYDAIIDFSLLLGRLNFKISYSVYSDLEFWVDCVQEVTRRVPGLIQNIYLQCYSGGEDQNPHPWRTALDSLNLKVPVYPGLWSIHENDDGDKDGHESADVQNRFSSWRRRGVKGGFMWFYDDMLKYGISVAEYARAIRRGLAKKSRMF